MIPLIVLEKNAGAPGVALHRLPIKQNKIIIFKRNNSKGIPSTTKFKQNIKCSLLSKIRLIIQSYSNRYIYQMGNLLVNQQERQAFLKAKQIRDQLHTRIENFRIKYRKDLSSINQHKKKIIKQASAAELTQLMDLGKVSSQEIMLTFIDRASVIGLRNGYVIDEIFEQALAAAKNCDEIRKLNPKKKCWRYGDDTAETFPPFFGVPVSLKESILYKGRISYVGHVYPINEIPTEDSQIVIMIKKMGLIPFVRTTVPQMNKTIETNNNITGYAKNPWNQTRSCGGSSGGEGGIVGGYVSPIGIGSDIAGSSRIPSDFTGSITLKPYYRYTNIGNAKTGKYAGGLPLRPETTAIAHTVQDVIIWNQFMYDRSNYQGIPKRLNDPYLKLIPFRNEVLNQKKKFTIGYYTDITGHTKCSPTNRRAVYEAIRLLERQGHSVKEIQIPNIQKFYMMLLRFWFSSRKLELLNEGRKGQKAIIQFKKAYLMSKFPYFLKVIIAMIIKKYQPRLSAMLINNKQMSSKDYFHLIHDSKCWQKQSYEYLKNHNIDIIISPTFFVPAYKLGQSHKYTYYLGHSPFWSIMNYPAGVVPVTTVKQDQLWFGDYYNDTSAKSTNKYMKEALGLPVGVQVASYPGHQEEILSVMKQIEQKVKFRQTYQCKTMLMDL